MQRYAYRVTNSTELPPCLPAVPQVLCAANPATPWVAPPPRLRRDRCLASHQWVGNNGDHPPPKKKNDQNMIQQGWNVKMTVNENKISTYHTYHTYTIMKTYLKHLKKRSKIHQLSTNTLPFKLCPSAPAFGWPESTSITERTWAPKSAPCWPAPKRPQVVTLVTNDHWEPLVTP
jgi:hypothetical protein